MSKKYIISNKGKKKTYTGDMENKVWIGTNQRTTPKGMKVIDVKDTKSDWNISGIPREDVKELRSRKKKN